MAKYHLTENSWGSTTPPKNKDEIINAFNRLVDDYITTYGLDDEDEIQTYAEALWESYCMTDIIGGVASIWE